MKEQAGFEPVAVQLAAAKSRAEQLGALADELGDLEAELLPWKAKIARADLLRRSLRAVYEDAPAGGPFQVHGERWSALLGAKTNQSVIDNERLYSLAGWRVFADMATFSLKIISERCGPEILGHVVQNRLTGPRPLSVIPKAPGVVPTAKRMPIVSKAIREKKAQPSA